MPPLDLTQLVIDPRKVAAFERRSSQGYGEGID